MNKDKCQKIRQEVSGRGSHIRGRMDQNFYLNIYLLQTLAVLPILMTYHYVAALS